MSERPESSATLSSRTISAAQWRLASAVVQGGLQFGITIVLARLLPPEDFGLVALAFVVVGFATMLSDLGLGPAVVQHNPLTERHLRVSFTSSMLIGTALAVLFWAAAPLFALVLRSTEVVAVMRWQAWLFVFSGLGTTARAVLQRSLDFRGLFFVNLASYGIGYAVVSVALAWMGFGVWSLVAGALMQHLLGGVLPLLQVRHSIRPLLARGEFRDLIGFGFGATLNRVVSYLSLNGDNFVVGRWLGPALLGLYARAYHLSALPLSYVSNVTWSVMFPAYAEIRSDRPRMRRAYLQAVQFIALVGGPIMAGMVIAAPHLVVGLYGSQWVGAVVPLQLFCAAAVFRTIYHASGAVTHALGELYAEFRRQVVYATLVAVGAVLGTRYGIIGVAAGVGVAILYMYLAMAALVIRLTDCRWRDFFAVQVPGLLLAALVAAAALAARIILEQRVESSLAVLAGIVAASAAVLPIGIYLLPRQFHPTELFGKIDRMVERLPGAVRPPIRRVLRIPAMGVRAG